MNLNRLAQLIEKRSQESDYGKSVDIVTVKHVLRCQSDVFAQLDFMEICGVVAHGIELAKDRNELAAD